jgi:glycosyltransferase involved in cell wall biosynthesis
VIFSGGKLEFRKGQDLVLKAFKLFHQRHSEALLVTAWGNKWDWRDTALAALTDTAPVQPAPDGEVDSARWALENGIPPDALIALGRTPNIAMPHVLREADVGLFANRCEGGTNLVAMECMACGVPVILSANTGHLDLLEPGDVALPLTRQAPVKWDGADVEGWGESDVDEIVERLETIWRNREAARSIGQRGAAFMATMTWDRQTERLLRALLPLMP